MRTPTLRVENYLPDLGAIEVLPAWRNPKAVKTDGWENGITGLGTYDRDKAMHAHFERPMPLSQNYALLSSIYHNDDISGRIIDTIPEHMFRRGWELKVKDDTNGEEAVEFEQESRRLDVGGKFKEGETWGRLFGGAMAVLGIDDGRESQEPVNEEAIKAINYINVVDRRFVMVHQYYGDPMAPNFGQPMVYRIYNHLIDPQTTPSNRNMVLVHESRIVRFEGAMTDPIERRMLAGWSHSVLQRPYEKIKAFVQAFQAAGNIMTDAAQGVYKLEGLVGQVAGGEVNAIQTRMMMLDMGRSVARAIVLDKDGEDFQRTVATIAGYPELLDRFMMLLSAATEIPVTILMGRSAAGMNATGDSDFRQFYSVISSQQTHKLEPRLQRIYRLMSLAKKGPSKGAERKFEFKFRSLWEPTLKEQAETNFTQAQADSLYVTMGAVTPEEIAISRFRGGETNLSTIIDIEARQQAQEALQSYDPYENDPEPQAEVPGFTAKDAGAGGGKVGGGALKGMGGGAGKRVVNQAPKK